MTSSRPYVRDGPDAPLRERLNSEAVVFLDEEHAVALRHRRHDLAGEAENRRLVGGAVPDDEGPASVGEPPKTRRSAEPGMAD